MQDLLRKNKILYIGQVSRSRRRSRMPGGRLILFCGFLAGIAAVFFGASYLIRLPQFRVHTVIFSGAVSIPEDALRSAVTAEISGNAFLFFPRDSYFFVSPEKIAVSLQKRFLSIREASVKKSATALSILIKERTVWGIACEKTELQNVNALPSADAGTSPPPENATGPCFYIDDGGIAFEEVASFAGGLLPIIYTDSGGGLGDAIVQKEDIAFFQDAASALASSLQLSLLSAEFSSASPDDARLALKDGWTILAPRGAAPDSWIGVLQTLLNEGVKDQRSRLDYVDLRFGNKVFYKFK